MERTAKKDMGRVIEKIMKVLELSKNNPSAEEAKAAALKAQRLMAEYHISEADIAEMADDPGDITQKSVSVGTGNKWKFLLSSVVAKNFRCKVFFYNRSVAVFYGHEVDAVIAADTFKFLFESGNKTATSYYNKLRNNAKKRGRYFDGAGIKNSFLIGYVDGIAEALERQCEALMIVVPQEVESGFQKMMDAPMDGYKNKPIKSTVKASVSYDNYRSGQRALEEGRRTGKSMLDSRKLEATA